MNVIAITSLFILFLLPAMVEAETIEFKNGTEVKAEIIEKDAQKIKVSVNGVPITYYLDDIEGVDGINPVEFVKPTFSADAVPQHIPQPVAAPAVAEKVSANVPVQDKKTLILQFVDAFGTRSSLEQNFEALAKRVPPAQVEEFKKALDVDDLIEQLIPLYDKHFTAEELQAYVEFYSSPAGKKLVMTIPQIMTESVGVSMKYFKSRIPAASPQDKK